MDPFGCLLVGFVRLSFGGARLGFRAGRLAAWILTRHPWAVLLTVLSAAHWRLLGSPETDTTVDALVVALFVWCPLSTVAALGARRLAARRRGEPGADPPDRPPLDATRRPLPGPVVLTVGVYDGDRVVAWLPAFGLAQARAIAARLGAEHPGARWVIHDDAGDPVETGQATPSAPEPALAAPAA